MGNTPITIGVETDKAGYTAGSTLRGKVYLSISSRQSTGVAAQVLQLRLVGKESAVVHHTSTNESNNSDTTDHHYERSSHTFFQVDYPLHTFYNQRAAAGQYEYPFQFNLPPNLPSTMKARDGESSCEVDYELVATLVQPGGGGIFNANPNGKKTLSVWSTIMEPKDSSVQHPVEDMAVGCCCAQKGNMSLEAYVGKTIVQHNDIVQVQFRCQNHSSLDVHSVKIQLEQVIEWSCNSRSKKVKRILDKLEFNGDQYPELEAALPKSWLCCLGGGGGGGRDYAQINSNPLPEEFHTVQLHVPEDANDTYRGNAVTIQHVLSVVLVSDGCCNSNPESATMMTLVKNFSDSGTEAAPSNDLLDHTTNANINASTTTPVFATAEVVMAEAQALPADWNAQTAQVVEIPMAEAMVMEPSAPPGPPPGYKK